MTPRECSELLTYASIIDNRTVAPETVQVWTRVLAKYDANMTAAEAREAVEMHFADEAGGYLMPKHVVKHVRRLREARKALEATPTCPRHGYPLTRLLPTCAACERENEDEPD